MPIEQVAVLGAGVMGAGIAAHLANAGVSVLMLDMPSPPGEGGRNRIADAALERLGKTDPAPLMHRRRARSIRTGNFEDDLGQLGGMDWIIEVVVERLDIKQDLYRRIDAARKPGTIVSSNTSTIPLGRLLDGLPEGLQRDFLITHFFNPPRYMRLLELVQGPHTRPEAVAAIREFCDLRLGKGVVDAKDTPGFIANRIGNLWLARAVADAVENGITVETADAVLGRPFGIPKTGVFGLLDLVGLDLMPQVRASMQALLPADDPMQSIPEPPAYLERLIAEGYTGRKGKGGFYRLNRDGGQRVKEALDLESGRYRGSERARPECLEAYRTGGLRALLESDDPAARYALRVMSATLAYSASLVPEIADSIVDVDRAMCLGYRWQKGPFALIDELGADWLAQRLEADGVAVPPRLAAARSQGFYREQPKRREYLTVAGTFAPLRPPRGCIELGDFKRAGPPVAGNSSASLWDVGEGVLCLEFHSKMNALDAGVMAMVGKAVERIGGEGRGLVIYNDAENFSVGANAGLILFASHLAMWDLVEQGLAGGQQAYRALKYAPFPVVGAPAGMALGGGCEILLHCDAVQAHAETYMGLVEAGVGLIPGWGGCKEMITRWIQHEQRPGGPLPAIRKVFETIAFASVSRSAEQARDSLFLLPRDRITMNRERLLADARARVLELADGYRPPEPAEIRLPGPSGKAAIALVVNGFRKTGLASAHDALLAERLAEVLTGGDTDITETITEDALLALERGAFLSMLRTPATAARLQHMLETGRPLRN